MSIYDEIAFLSLVISTPNVGLELMTPRSRITHSSDWAMQVPWLDSFFIMSRGLFMTAIFWAEKATFLLFLAQKICKERNCLVHLLSPDRKVSNMLDLSQKVVCEGSELHTAPRDAAVLWALVVPRALTRAWGGLAEGRRPGCLKPVLTPLGHSPCGLGESPASLRDSLSSLV